MTKRAGKGNSLLLSAGKFVDPALGEILKPDERKNFLYRVSDLGARAPGNSQSIGDVLAHRHVREQPQTLKHHVRGALLGA